MTRIGGANGFHRITPRGLTAYESARKKVSDRLAIRKFVMDVPLPLESPDDLPGSLESPQALVTIHSDKMDAKDLNFFEYGELAPLITKFIASVAKKRFSAALTGSLYDDRVNFRFIPPDERRRPIEKQRHARFVTWLQNVQMMKFGVYLEFDGYSWVDSVDWQEMNEWAKRGDVQDEEDLKTFQMNLSAIRQAYENRKREPADDLSLESLGKELTEQRKKDEMTEEGRKHWKRQDEIWKEIREDDEAKQIFMWYVKNKMCPAQESGTKNHSEGS